MREMKLVFGYHGGEKSVITTEDLTRDQIHTIAESIAKANSDFIVIDIPTTKQDIVLINRPQLLFFYATPVTKKIGKDE